MLLLPGALRPNHSLSFVCRDVPLTVERADTLVAKLPEVPRAPYSDSGRSLEPLHRARQLEGVVVSGVQARFEADGRVSVQGEFSQHGAQASPTFVPLLVLTDTQGRELGEAYGKAVRLQAGQSQQVALQLPAAARQQQAYFVSLIVSHPDTGRPIGKDRKSVV